MVILTTEEGKPSETICGYCYNAYMAEMLEVEDYKDFEPEVTFTDCEGIEHCLEIRKKIYPTGICWEVLEFL